MQKIVNAPTPISGVIARFAKQDAAATYPTTFFLVKRTHENAIEYTGSPAGTRGLLLFVGLVTATVGLWGSQDILLGIIAHDEIDFSDVVGVIAAFIFSSASVYLFTICARIELFRPFDEPFVFDRKNRKVYRNYREASLNWRGLFQPWPCKTDTYNWDDVHAEHHAVVNANSATVSRAHSLVFLVHESRDNPTVIAEFAIGGIHMGELSVPAVWEHIRRFMEENGPHILAGEPLMQIEPPTSLWKILSNMGPYGRGFPIWCKTMPFLTLFAFLFSPILLPGCIILSICAWISYKTAYPFDWPQEVLDAIGPPISQP